MLLYLIKKFGDCIKESTECNFVITNIKEFGNLKEVNHMILKLEDCSFSYTDNKPILTNISFSLKQGEVLAIMGCNGIGKTTLLKCIAGILKWDRGTCIFDGQNMIHTKRIKNIGYVPQARKLPFSYLVKDLVVFGRNGTGSYFQSPGKEDYEIVDNILNDLGIYHLKNRYCNELSGGQLQMVFIAKALSSFPKLLILDEPESHLDFYNQFKVLMIIKDLAKKRGISAIINSHYPNNIMKIADKCLLLNKDKYTYGDTKTIMTEETIKDYFYVDSKLIDMNYFNQNISSFVFLGTC